jgi:hypothetical protein
MTPGAGIGTRIAITIAATFKFSVLAGMVYLLVVSPVLSVPWFAAGVGFSAAVPSILALASASCAGEADAAVK